ncbi:MAG: inorganic phosphate transporter [Parachlamydiales bacterium]
MVLLILALAFGFYVAWNIGANDVANAMGTSVGSGALTLRRAVILAALLEFAGAFLLGSHVTETVESGVVSPAFFESAPRFYVYGMLSSLLAAGVWLQIASYFGWPVSTTHSIIGALIGFGLIAAGPAAIAWGEVSSIVASWIVSPLMGGVLGFVIFNAIRRQIFYVAQPIKAAKRLTPVFVFVIISVLLLVLLYKGIESPTVTFSFWGSLGLAVGSGLVCALVAYLFVRRIEPTPQGEAREQEMQIHTGLEKALKHLRRVRNSAQGELYAQVVGLVNQARTLAEEISPTRHYEALETEHRTVEKIFVYLQIISACFMAFAHGANDVANAIGPLNGVIATLRSGQIVANSPIPLWLLGLGGVGIVIGLATWGWRVIQTVGRRITELTPTRGFAAEFGAAFTILIASRMGLPISTTHTLVGAVMGVGLARGIGAINLTMIRDIVISWVITVPIGALFAVLFYEGFVWIFR